MRRCRHNWSLEFGAGFTARTSQTDSVCRGFCRHQDCAHTGAQLRWSHFRLIIYLKDDLQSDFYAEMCRIERLGVRTLEKKIDGMLFERTALSRKPAKLVRQELEALRDEDKVTPDLVFPGPVLPRFPGSQKHLQ